MENTMTSYHNTPGHNIKITNLIEKSTPSIIIIANKTGYFIIRLTNLLYIHWYY